MITWDAKAVVIWCGTCTAHGRTLRLEVEPSTLVVADTVWYWRVRDEEGAVQKNGTRHSALQAKASCTRAANKYAKAPRP